MQIGIRTAYTTQYPDPICFEAGAEIRVERGDPDFPGWYWCRVPSGKEGWVHQSFLTATTGTVTALHAYTAKELTVTAGERGTLIRVLDGWAFVLLENGEEGWIPETHIGPIPSAPSGGGGIAPTE